MKGGITILGAGFIGRNFISRILDSGLEVRVLDHKVCPDEFKGRLVWIQGDLADADVVGQAVQNAEVVYHFVSSTVPGDLSDEAAELTQNVLQTIQLLKCCVQERVRRMVFVSSASVYGEQTLLPIPETALTNPISSHGIHKLTIEKYLQLYQYHHGLECKIVRLSNPYGPGQDITGRQGFIAIAIGRVLAGEPIKIRGDGSTTRDYVYIDDVTEVLEFLGTSATRDSIFNVGSGMGYTLNQVVAILGQLLGRQIQVEHTENRFVDIPASVLDISHLSGLMGKTPQVSLEAGLKKTLAFHGISLAGQTIQISCSKRSS